MTDSELTLNSNEDYRLVSLSVRLDFVFLPAPLDAQFPFGLVSGSRSEVTILACLVTRSRTWISESASIRSGPVSARTDLVRSRGNLDFPVPPLVSDNPKGKRLG